MDDLVKAVLDVFSPDARVVGVAGSRWYPRKHDVRRDVRALAAHSPDAVVASGTLPGERDPAPYGVDEVAICEAKDAGLAWLVFEPEWDDGPSAGPVRNGVLVDHCSDVMCYWDGRSRGTADAILNASLAGNLRLVKGPDGSRIDPDDAAIEADRILRTPRKR